jgi:hypothetical protein
MIDSADPRIEMTATNGFSTHTANIQYLTFLVDFSANRTIKSPDIKSLIPNIHFPNEENKKWFGMLTNASSGV